MKKISSKEMQILTNDASLNRGKAPAAAKQMPVVLYCGADNGCCSNLSIITRLKIDLSPVLMVTVDSDNTEL